MTCKLVLADFLGTIASLSDVEAAMYNLNFIDSIKQNFQNVYPNLNIRWDPSPSISCFNTPINFETARSVKYPNNSWNTRK